MVHWQKGRSRIWDATFVSSYSASHLNFAIDMKNITIILNFESIGKKSQKYCSVPTFKNKLSNQSCLSRPGWRRLEIIKPSFTKPAVATNKTLPNLLTLRVKFKILFAFRTRLYCSENYLNWNPVFNAQEIVIQKPNICWK